MSILAWSAAVEVDAPYPKGNGADAFQRLPADRDAGRGGDGKAALITGGSDGLGKAMAMRFVDADANVAILARRADVLEAARAEIDEAGPGKALCYSCDLLNAIATTDAFAAAGRDLDGIDILVNNAWRCPRWPHVVGVG